MLRSDLNIFMDDVRSDLRYGLTADAWSAVIIYDPGDYVINNEVTYRCILQADNQEPPDATYWVTVLVKRPRGKVYMNSVDLAANYADGLLVGVALGLPVYRKASLAAGKYEYLDEAGNTLLTNV